MKADEYERRPIEASDPEREAGRERTKKRFLLIANEDFLDCFDGFSPPECINPVVDSFKRNLMAAVNIGTIPFFSVHAAAMSSRYQTIITSERIRSLKTDYGEQSYITTAKSRMKEELSNPDTHRRIGLESLDRLSALLTSSEEFANTADELLRQVLVMSWCAFEVLASDLIAALTTHLPALALPILRSKKVQISPDMLERYGFDLSLSMGKILSEAMKMDSLGAIRNIYAITLSSDKLNIGLADNSLWLIFQRRNLIVHRRGIVDLHYLSKTSDTLAVGEAITIQSDDAEAALETVREVGLTMIQEATGFLKC